MPIEWEWFSKDLKYLNMKLREKAFIQNYSYTHEQKPGRNGLFTREEKGTNGKVRLKHEELNFGKERWMGKTIWRNGLARKNAKIITKHRRIGQRKDQERIQTLPGEHPTTSANLRNVSSSCIPFSQLELLCFSRSIDVTYRSQEIFWMGLPASCSTMTFDVVSLTTRKSWYRQESKQRSVVNYL